MRFLLLLFFLIFTTAAVAQTTVRGTITDAADKEPVLGAAAVLIHLLDSAQVGAATNLQGRFIIPNVMPGRYLLQVSFVGYQAHQRQLTVGAEPIELGTIALSEGATQLREVQIVAKIPPATQNDDTTQFNAA